jgi:HAD superfamily hydrolase (TIGR01549 family)
MLKLCAFDLGNTLGNDTLLFREAVRDVSEWLGVRGAADAEEFRAVYEEINRETFLPFISHTYGEIEFFENTFARLGIDDVTPQETLSAYREFLQNRLSVDPALVDGLEYLRSRGIRLCILSNERTERVKAFLAKTGLAPLFDEVFVSEAVGVEKPDERIFRIALERFALRGEEAAMFGDNEIADGGCRSLGMLFVLVTAYKNNGWRWEEGSPHPPDYVMDRITRESLQSFCAWMENPDVPKR